MLVNLNDIMKKAVDANRIIPAFNVFGFEDAQMVIEIAESVINNFSCRLGLS